MTVNYMRQAATTHSSTCVRLLFRWRASVWKSVATELLVWLFFFFLICAVYRFGLLHTEYESHYTSLVQHCDHLASQASQLLSVALGFYVSQIYTRWWSVFMAIPWPDQCALEVCAFIRTRKEKNANPEDVALRKSIMRYLSLSYVLVFRDISERIMRRLPTLNHLVMSRLVTENEKKKLEEIDDQRRYWLPIEWAILRLRQCYENRQINDIHFTKITNSILMFRERLHHIMSYDWVNVPLVYTQCAHLCVFVFFALRLFGSQPIVNSKYTNSIYVQHSTLRRLIMMWVPPTTLIIYDTVRNVSTKQPIPIKIANKEDWLSGSVVPLFTCFEFVIFFGLLKVAQVMINPFGLDDDDFDVDVIIERNLQLSFSYVDHLYERLPPLVDMTIKALPHTKASAAGIEKANPMVGSAAGLNIPKKEQQVLSTDEVAKFFDLERGRNRKPHVSNNALESNNMPDEAEHLITSRDVQESMIGKSKMLTPSGQGASKQSPIPKTRTSKMSMVSSPPPPTVNAGGTGERETEQPKMDPDRIALLLKLDRYRQEQEGPKTRSTQESERLDATPHVTVESNNNSRVNVNILPPGTPKVSKIMGLSAADPTLGKKKSDIYRERSVNIREKSGQRQKDNKDSKETKALNASPKK